MPGPTANQPPYTQIVAHAPDPSNEPALRLAQLVPVDPLPDGRWLVRWSVKNGGNTPLQIQRVWLPHGQFRAAEQEVNVSLAMDKSVQLDIPVAFSAPPADIVENAFAIFRVQRSMEQWRVFVRLTVRPDESGAPRAEIGPVTTQRLAHQPATPEIRPARG